MTDDEILTDLETFNSAMIQFKEAVDTKGREEQNDLLTDRNFVFPLSIDFDRMPNLFNQCLSLLKHIIETYRLMDSIDVLEYAAKLIHLLQGNSHRIKIKSDSMKWIENCFFLSFRSSHVG